MKKRFFIMMVRYEFGGGYIDTFRSARSFDTEAEAREAIARTVREYEGEDPDEGPNNYTDGQYDYSMYIYDNQERKPIAF